MRRKKVLFVFGTRPEAVKMAPIIREIKGVPDLFEARVAVTGQHRHMLDQVLKVFGIKPDHDLKIMEEGQTLSAIASRSLSGLEKVIARDKPDVIIVQGDTTSAFAAGLAAFYHKIKLAHVEAGLRTGKKFNPFPEEMNRKLITLISDLHFAPTAMSERNLLDEGVPKNNIFVTGNTVIDALRLAADTWHDLKKDGIDAGSDGRRIVLLTAHRRESFGPPLKEICEAAKKIALNRSNNARVIIPMHKNPRVRKIINDALHGLKDVTLIEPLDYIPFVHLMKASYLILTDSGGIQEEAPSLGKPVLVMRETTERPEAIIAKTVKLVGTGSEKITAEAEKLLNDKTEYDKMARAVNPYGDGMAAKRIIEALKYHFGAVSRRPEEFSVSITEGEAAIK